MPIQHHALPVQRRVQHQRLVLTALATRMHPNFGLWCGVKRASCAPTEPALACSPSSIRSSSASRFPTCLLGSRPYDAWGVAEGGWDLRRATGGASLSHHFDHHCIHPRGEHLPKQLPLPPLPQVPATVAQHHSGATGAAIQRTPVLLALADLSTYRFSCRTRRGGRGERTAHVLHPHPLIVAQDCPHRDPLDLREAAADLNVRASELAAQCGAHGACQEAEALTSASSWYMSSTSSPSVRSYCIPVTTDSPRMV